MFSASVPCSRTFLTVSSQPAGQTADSLLSLYNCASLAVLSAKVIHTKGFHSGSLRWPTVHLVAHTLKCHSSLCGLCGLEHHKDPSRPATFSPFHLSSQPPFSLYPQNLQSVNSSDGVSAAFGFKSQNSKPPLYLTQEFVGSDTIICCCPSPQGMSRAIKQATLVVRVQVNLLH